MPRFYFHVHDEVLARDHEGLELPDIEAARREAIAGAREIMAEELKKSGRLRLRDRIEIADEQERIVLTVPFKEVVSIEG